MVGVFKKNLMGLEILDNVMILVNFVSYCFKGLYRIYMDC